MSNENIPEVPFDFKGFLIVLVEKSVTIAIGMMLMFVINFRSDFQDVVDQCKIQIDSMQSEGMESQLFKNIKLNISVNSSIIQANSGLNTYNSKSVQT